MSKKRWLSKKGNVAIEFLVILPMLMMIVASVVELGTLMYKKVTLVNATEMGTQMYAATRDYGRARAEVDNNYRESARFDFACGLDIDGALAWCESRDHPKAKISVLSRLVNFEFHSKSYAPVTDK